MIKNKNLFILGLIVFLFTFFVAVLVCISGKRLEDKYREAISEYVFNSTEQQITDIVLGVEHITSAALESSYRTYNKKINLDAKNLFSILNRTPESQWCDSINYYVKSIPDLHFSLVKKDVLMCSNFVFPADKKEKSPYFTPQEDIYLTKKITDNAVLLVGYKKESIYNSVKHQIIDFLDKMKFANPDTYVWITEVLNYNGGDDYAISFYHPNLPESEGKLLSTKTQDIEGKKPYLTELNGIKKDGEIYQQYSFKKKTSDIIAHKISYAKLFKPFNWIIATGVYLDDINQIIDMRMEKVKREFKLSFYLLISILLILSLFLLLLLYDLQKNIFVIKEKELVLKQHLQDVENYRQVLYSLLDLIEKRDSYTAGHTKRVAEYSLLIAKEIGFSQNDLDVLYEAAIMHDIGKVSTPDSILLKPGKLNKNEHEIIQNHLVCGYEILSTIDAFKEHAEIMRNHHERYDGRGYPRGLKGDNISVISHILILTDAFDAMTSNRIYKAPKSLETALQEIDSLKGKQFSPEVAEVAIPLLRKRGIIPAEQNYLSNEFEQARLVYYYKDPLTGLYNYKYFNYILKSNKNIRCCYFIEISNFFKFNKKYGWVAGNNKLIEISNALVALFPDSILFRAFGDDFLVCSKEHIEITKDDLVEKLNIDNEVFGLNLYHLDLKNTNIYDFEQLQTMIDSLMQKPSLV